MKIVKFRIKKSDLLIFFFPIQLRTFLGSKGHMGSVKPFLLIIDACVSQNYIKNFNFERQSVSFAASKKSVGNMVTWSDQFTKDFHNDK